MGKYNSNANTNVTYMLLDILYGLISYLLAVIVTGTSESFTNLHYFSVCAIFILLVITFNKNRRVYNTTLFFYTDRIISYISGSFFEAAIIVTALTYVIGNTEIKLRFYIIFLVISYLLFHVSAFLNHYIMRKSGIFAMRTIFVGSKAKFEKAIHFLSRNSMVIKHLGYICETETVPEGDDTDYLGTINQLEDILHEHAADQVFFLQDTDNPRDMHDWIELCLQFGVVVRLLEPPYHIGHAQNYVCSIGTYPMVTYHNVVMNEKAKAAKRAFDIIGSLIGIILSSPIMLITAIAIKIDSKGPVIFKQERVGLNGRHFKMLKFRSMVADAEALKKNLEKQNQMSNNLMFKVEDDPRITRVGKFIRKTSIDELPQFFNVFVGDMSLVGTRPPTLDEVDQYSTYHWRRLSTRPGITGMWQVSGRNNITDFDEVVALDTEYIDNWSFWLDFKICCKTVWQVVARKSKAM